MEPIWPGIIDDAFQESGFRYSIISPTAQSEMTAGFAEARSLYSDAVWNTVGVIWVPFTDIRHLMHFYQDVLKNGVLAFRKADPIDPSVSHLWRFTNFSIGTVSGLTLAVTVGLERKPASQK